MDMDQEYSGSSSPSKSINEIYSIDGNRRQPPIYDDMTGSSSDSDDDESFAAKKDVNKTDKKLNFLLSRTKLSSSPTAEPTFDTEGSSNTFSLDEEGKKETSQAYSEIEKKLQLAFELPELEHLQGEFACWCIRSVLLKGYIYLTEGHICFYAKLPDWNNESALKKSGYLGRRSSKLVDVRGRWVYNNFWFVLNGDLLNFYENSKVSFFFIFI
jgi:sterol 3beta-glucosyltransferase